MGGPAAVTSAETTRAATSAAAEPATDSTQTAAAAMVRVPIECFVVVVDRT